MRLRSIFFAQLLFTPALCPAQTPAFGPASICADDGPLVWAASEFPPYAWKDEQGLHGYAVELVELMAKRIGREASISFFPWVRTLRMTERGQRCGIFPMLRTPERESHFRWLMSAGKARYVFYGKLQTPLEDKAAMRKARIGVLRGAPMKKQLQDEGFTQIVEVNSYRDLVRMLENDSLGAIFGLEINLEANVELYGVKADQALRKGPYMGGNELFFAASPGLSDDEAEAWMQAWREVVRDGLVAKLRRKYKLDVER
ncbi:MAG TPA: transporter substrate-binding domain-containing protein [Burkholderiaceae bacterium]|jgi:polar amino acid transport system substrate-binding protein